MFVFYNQNVTVLQMSAVRINQRLPDENCIEKVFPAVKIIIL